MIKKKLLNIILSFSLLLQALVFQVALPNLVLCFGDDGHIAFELLGESSQCDHNDSAHNIIPFQSENEITGILVADCIDIDLHFFPSFAEHTQKKNYFTDTVKLIGQYLLWTNDCIPYSSCLKLTHFSPLDPIIGTIQSTVLII